MEKSMTQINPGQLKALNTLVSKLGIDKETKSIMVQGFSSGRCISSKELLSDEANDMIKHLKSLDPEEAKAEKMRRKIISLAHEMGWKVDNKADMKRIDNWCMVYGHGKKRLNSYTYKELPTLVSQFESVYKYFLERL